MLSWFRERHQRSIREQPFPEAWLPFLERNVLHYALLTEEEQAQLRGDIQVFLSEKHWEGVGLEITEEIQVTVSALACLLQLCLENRNFYPNVETILIYPSSYWREGHESLSGGVVLETSHNLEGEAYSVGPVVLSWSDVVQGGRNIRDGHNLVLHEFAHKLDMLDSSAWGVPQLETEEQAEEWTEVMQREYGRLIEETERGKMSILNSYGATNPAEFFAVATETFFEKPLLMEEDHSRLYEILRAFYRQDPADRFRRARQLEDAESE